MMIDKEGSELIEQLKNHNGNELAGQIFSKDPFDNNSLITLRLSTMEESGAFHCKLDEDAARDQIHHMYSLGWYYKGDFHTHPEPHPSPSLEDITTIKDVKEKSELQWNILMIIIGYEDIYKEFF